MPAVEVFGIGIIVPKHHLMMHISLQAEIINPRFVQNYLEEGLVGKICRVWTAVANGPYRATAQRSVLVRHLIALQVQYHIN